MTAMRSEASIKPLFAHHDKHYFRAYSLVQIGNSYSRQNEEEIGYVSHCFKCGSRRIVPQFDFYEDPGSELNCSNCDNKVMKFAGPLWIGCIQSMEFVENCFKISDLPVFRAELDIPLYFDLATIADELEIRTPKIDSVISRLNSTGHSASRTRLNPTAVRTDAPRGDLQKILRELVR